MQYGKTDTHQCNLKLPFFGQCEEKGPICGGYNRDRNFVVQNPGVKLAASSNDGGILEDIDIF